MSPQMSPKCNCHQNATVTKKQRLLKQKWNQNVILTVNGFILTMIQISSKRKVHQHTNVIKKQMAP